MDEPLHERTPFCTQCGFVSRIDTDGTCGVCGLDTCGLDQMRALLAVEGLHIVSAVDRKVLDAAGEFYDARFAKDDERAFDKLMAAVHASRDASKETS